MVKLTKQLWSQSSAFKIILCCIGLTAIFLIYLVLIGIPRTQARNLYNKALTVAQLGAITSERRYLQQALVYWPEGYIQSKLDQIK